MTTYSKITDFAAKDALLTGNPAKIVKGTEIGAEFDAIALADASNAKGPASGTSTDNALVRWDSTTGRLLQNSGVTVNDSGVLTAPEISSAIATITSLLVPAINAGPLFGNRIKNGNKLIAQRGTTSSIVAGTAVPTASTGYYTTDRFFAYCTGANVTTIQQVGADDTHKQNVYTGAASVSTIGHGTRLEASETAHMAGQTCTYTVELANSLLTTVTWTAYYANTTDTFGTIASPTKTQIATGSFTVTSTVTKYSTQVSLPAGATTGIEILLTVGAQTSGNWTIRREDFRLGSVSPTYFEVPDRQQELARCQRYYYRVFPAAVSKALSTSGYSVSATVFQAVSSFPVQMRITPTVLEQSGTATQYAVNTGAGTTVCSAVPTIASGAMSNEVWSASFTTAAVLTAGSGGFARTDATTGASAYLGFPAEIA